MALAIAAASTPACADLTGFVQLRQVQRVRSPQLCCQLSGRKTMAQEALGELLYERRLGDQLSATARVEAYYDNALSRGNGAIREGFVDWAPTSSIGVKLGRQVLTWGVSDYLYVNDVFPKNYDAFFTGAGFDRMKEPVDAAKLVVHEKAADFEAVVSRRKADKQPHAERFTAMSMTKGALAAEHPDDQADIATKVSAHIQGWDVAAYAASFASREARFSIDATGLRSDLPRTRHLGFSITGNAAGGLTWLEGAVRRTEAKGVSVVSRHFLDSAVKFIGGYSRELSADVSISTQLQLEASTSRDRYTQSLAPGVRPLRSVSSTLHLRVQGRWLNQTLTLGAQVFAGDEGDTHLNPFGSWSPADGWTVEGGANLFNGKPDTRYGAFKDDSNVYVLARFSF